MKNQLISTIVICAFIASCNSKPSYVYKHTEKEQSISCDSKLDALLNEALYVFEDDIIAAYNKDDGMVTSGYARFLYVGFSGTAEYERVVSQEALDIRKELIAQGIIRDGGNKSNLNYNHPIVNCLLEKMEDQDIAATMSALINTNTMDPKLFNTRMRNFNKDARKQRYLALYVALDTYYQQLTMTTLPGQETND